jgi:hypothetical protein
MKSIKDEVLIRFPFYGQQKLVHEMGYEGEYLRERIRFRTGS